MIDRLFAPNAVRAAEEKRVADSSPKEKAKTRAKRATKEHSAQQGGLFGTPKGDDE